MLNESRKYFPAVGLLIGAICSISYVLCSAFLPQSIAVMLSVVSGILATGAFHEDGFADSCDGLGGGWDKEQVLTIMKDSRLGTYGAVGLFGLLTLKVVSLIILAQSFSASIFCLMLIAAHAASRQLSSMAIDHMSYVQDIDQSKVKPITENRLSIANRGLSILLCSLPFVVSVFYLPSLILATIPAAIIVVLFLYYSHQRIGGYTGDILGACQQLSELAFYLVCLALFTGQ